MFKIRSYIIISCISFLIGCIFTWSITYRLKQTNIDRHKALIERAAISLQQIKDKSREQRETNTNITEHINRGREAVREIETFTRGDIETIERIIEYNRRIYELIEARGKEE